MNHLCLVSTFPPDTCGIASYTQYLSDALGAIKSDLRMSVVAEGRGGVGSSSLPAVRRGFDRDDDYVGHLEQAIQQLSPDLVHIQHEFGIFGIDERFLRLVRRIRRRGVPVVVTLHTVHTQLSIDLGCAWQEPGRLAADFDVEAYFREIGDAASHLIVHQKEPIRDVLVRMGVDPAKVSVIPHGTLLEAAPGRSQVREQIGLRQEGALVVAFGYFERSKNTHRLIEAVGHLIREGTDVRLWVGCFVRRPFPDTLKYRHQCRALASRLGIDESITWESRPVPEDRLKAVLGAGDIACFPYAEDTRAASGALHRALGIGTIVVASRIPKFDEVRTISDELLVSPESASELARLLRRLITDESFRSFVRWRIDEFARATCWPKVASQHLDLYERVLPTTRAAVQRPMADYVEPEPLTRKGMSLTRSAR